ncbi:MAG: bifunctional UDP-sugar hydrolase/5'-nucleotidase [Arachnia sp.]
MSTARRVTATLSAAALAASAFVTLAPLSAEAAPGQCVAGNPTKTVTVFAFNDFHGRIFDDSKTPDNAAGYLAGKLFTPVEQARAADGDDSVLLLSSGDNIGASTFVSMMADDDPTLDILNAAGLEASTVGNHEFDKGWSDLSGRVVPKASGFDYLGANVYEKGTTTVAAPLKAYDIIEKAGVKIGIVGAVTADVPSLVSPGGIENLTIGDPVEAINRVTAQLLDGDDANGEADVVIASLHEGAANGKDSAETNAAASEAFDDIYRDIDERVSAIFNAHTHQEYTYTSANVADRPIIQAGSYAGKLAKVELTLDTVGKGVCGVTQEIVSPAAESDESLPAIKAINDIARAAYNEAMEKGQEVIGEATAAISTPGDKGNADVRNVESPMTNLVAQMFADILGADDPEFIGVQNPGGTRDSFTAGEITYRQAALTLPFANSLFTTQLTGAQFKTVLEQQWQRDAEGNVPSRPFLALGLSDNVSYTYDESLPEGSRITSISMNGEPMDMDKLYTVGSGSFLITGGDNFREFAGGVDTKDTGLSDLGAWVAYVSLASPLSPDYSVRGVSTKAPEGTLVEGGAPLEFSFGAPLAGGIATQTLDMFLQAGDPKVSPPLKNTAITAYLGDLEIGSGTVVDGAGTVSVALPEGVEIDGVEPGEEVLAIVEFNVEESNTSIFLPVTLKLQGSPDPTPSPTPTPTSTGKPRPGLPDTGN